MYLVKEIFYSLQGEGAQTGRPAVFYDLLDVTYGMAEKKIDSRQFVVFAILILLVLMELMAENIHPQMIWQHAFKAFGQK